MKRSPPGKAERSGTRKTWPDGSGPGRPALPKEKAWLLDMRYSGESTASKLARVRGKMKEAGAGAHLLSSLDDIAWLLNLRGNDIAYCPLVLSYLLVFEDHAELFADGDKFPDGVPCFFGRRAHHRETLQRGLPGGLHASGRDADPAGSGPGELFALPEHPGRGGRSSAEENPEVLMKCRKNDTEIRNIRSAHLKDAAACTKFMYWLKACCMAAGEDGEDEAADGSGYGRTR